MKIYTKENEIMDILKSDNSQKRIRKEIVAILLFGLLALAVWIIFFFSNVLINSCLIPALFVVAVPILTVYRYILLIPSNNYDDARLGSLIATLLTAGIPITIWMAVGAVAYLAFGIGGSNVPPSTQLSPSEVLQVQISAMALSSLCYLISAAMVGTISGSVIYYMKVKRSRVK